MPDGVFGNDTFSYIRNWLITKGRIWAIIDVPIETFMPNTSTKTSILIFQKVLHGEIPKKYKIFMAIAESCGHDRRGNSTQVDDISEISTNFKEWQKENNLSF